jgi:hypothetical protein
MVVASRSIIRYCIEKKESDSRDECKECVKLKENKGVNAYNLYTYDQILQIEKSLGRGDVVFCYSRNRNDGKGAGQDKAEMVVKQNVDNEIEYYYFYYDENNADRQEVISKKGEFFINLVDQYPDKYMDFLDYRIYRDSDFDIMIYEHNNVSAGGSNPEKIEGYYGLNFPVRKKGRNETVLACTVCKSRENCSLRVENGQETDRILYKRMPISIVKDLHTRLQTEVQNYKKRHNVAFEVVAKQ